jgi:hypothetical protein
MSIRVYKVSRVALESGKLILKCLRNREKA